MFRKIHIVSYHNEEVIQVPGVIHYFLSPKVSIEVGSEEEKGVFYFCVYTQGGAVSTIHRDRAFKYFKAMCLRGLEENNGR